MGGIVRPRLTIANPFGYEIFDPTNRGSRMFGGAEVQLAYFAEAIAARGSFDVSMIVERASQPMQASIKGIDMVPVRRNSTRVAMARDVVPVPSLKWVNAIRATRPDVVLQRGAAVLTGDCVLAARMSGARFVFMIAHDWDCTNDHLRGRQFLSGRYYRSALRHADLVIAQSEHQRSLVREWHGIESVVIPTVYPTAPAIDEVRNHVLWIGRCVSWKQPFAFIELARKTPDVPFLMVAPPVPGEQELASEVERAARALPNMTFVEFVSFPETEALFKQAIALVNTSVAEGFPNTFAQAARSATPLASLCVDPDGIIANRGLGTFGAGSVDVLAYGLQDLVRNESVWTAASNACLSYFEETHDLAKVSKNLEARLGSLADRVAGSRQTDSDGGMERPAASTVDAAQQVVNHSPVESGGMQ